MGERVSCPSVLVAGMLLSQLNSPFSTLRSAASGIKKPHVIASIKGGHFFTVINSRSETELKQCWGRFLNQSGKPRTAGIGLGKTDSISGGQRNFIVNVLSSSTAASLSRLESTMGPGSTEKLIRKIKCIGDIQRQQLADFRS